MCNHGQNICRLFHVLAQISFHRKWNVRVASRVVEPCKIFQCLELMTSTQPATQNANFDSCVKHSMEKPILLNFVNLSSIFCPRLWIISKNQRNILQQFWWQQIIQLIEISDDLGKNRYSAYQTSIFFDKQETNRSNQD